MWRALVAAILHPTAAAKAAGTGQEATNAYRINLPWWMFAVAGFLALLVALGTVSFQAARAAAANPVKSLRSE